MSASETKKRPGRAGLPRREPETGRDDCDREIMTLRGLAEYLNCNYVTVFKLANRGEIPAFRVGGHRVGGHWRCRLSDINRWIADRQVKPEGRGGREGKGRGRRPKSG